MTNLNDDARWLVNELAEAKALAKAVSKPQLGTSSIESGKIEEYDSEGTLSQIIGEQHDGTHTSSTVAGPTPPEPMPPTVTVGVASAEVRANGKFADGAMSPMDLSHFAVHASRLEVFGPDNTTQKSTIQGESGDLSVILIEPGAWTFGLVAVSKAGKWSSMSETVTVEIADYPTTVDIQQELIDLDEKYDGVIVDAGNLGTRLEDAETALVESGQRLTQAEIALAPLPGKLAAAETKINTDIPVAIKAADDAAKMALLIAPVSTAAPVLADGTGRPIGSIWTHIDGSGNEIGYWRWTASGWVVQALSVTVIPNIAASKITSGQIDVARLNAGAVAAAVGTFLELNASQITAGEILTARLNALEIAAATAAFQTVDIKNLFASTGTMTELVSKRIWADLASFNRVTAQMLAIGSFDNMIVDPDFNDAALTAARFVASSASVVGPAVVDSADGRKYIPFPVAAGSSSFKMFAENGNRPSPVVPGATYRVRFQARVDSGTGGARVAATIYMSDGTTAYVAVTPSSFTALTTSWQWCNYSYTMPDNATGAYFDVQRQGGGTGIVHMKTPSATRMNGGELVVDGSIKAVSIDVDDLVADTGYIAKLVAKIVKADMFVGKEFTGGTFTGATFQTSILPDQGMKLDGAGLRAYGPDGGEPVAEIRPDGGTVYQVSDPATGEVLGGIDSAGGVTGTSLSISEAARMDGPVIIGGDPLNGTHGTGDNGLTSNGRDFFDSNFFDFFENHPATSDSTTWLASVPRGVITNAWREHVGALGMSGLGGQEHLRILMTTTANFESGRIYSIGFRTPAFKQTGTLNAGTVGYATVRRSDPGGSVTPGGAGGTVAGTLYYYPAGGGAQAITGTTYVRCPEDIPAGKIMFAIQIACYPGLTMESIDNGNSNRWELVVADMGLRVAANAARIVDLRKQGTETAPPAPAPDPDPIRQYTDTVSATWWQAYVGGGTQATHSTYNGSASQGRTPYAPSNGVMRGLIGIPSQSERLSGATVKKIEVYVYAKAWHASAGGTACIGVHSHASKPGTWSSTTDNVKQQKMKRPEGRWITLPSSVHAGFKNGTLRGISFLPPSSSTSTEYYGILTGNKTKFRFTYTK